MNAAPPQRLFMLYSFVDLRIEADFRMLPDYGMRRIVFPDRMAGLRFQMRPLNCRTGQLRLLDVGQMVEVYGQTAFLLGLLNWPEATSFREHNPPIMNISPSK